MKNIAFQLEVCRASHTLLFSLGSGEYGMASARKIRKIERSKFQNFTTSKKGIFPCHKIGE